MTEAESPSVDYEQVSHAEYASTVIASQGFQHDPYIVSFRGECPRCGLPMVFVHRYRIVRDQRVEEEDQKRDRVITMYCKASAVFRGAPKDAEGCGAHWSIRL